MLVAVRQNLDDPEIRALIEYVRVNGSLDYISPSQSFDVRNGTVREISIPRAANVEEWLRR